MSNKGLEGLLAEWRDKQTAHNDSGPFVHCCANDLQPFYDQLVALLDKCDDMSVRAAMAGPTINKQSIEALEFCSAALRRILKGEGHESAGSV